MNGVDSNFLVCSEKLPEAPIELPEIADIDYFSPDYLHYFSLLAPNLESPMIHFPEIRVEVVNWILKVSSKLDLTREAAHTAVIIFDKTTTLSQDFIPSSLLLSAMSSLLLASKFLQQGKLKVKKLNKFTDFQFSIGQVLSTELKCLSACMFQLPSVHLNHWLSFVTHEWDRYIITTFNLKHVINSMKPADGSIDSVILFRQCEKESYKRFKKASAMIDLIIMSPKYYYFEHRLLAIAILWKIVYAEMGENGFCFYKKYGIPAISDMFGKVEDEEVSASNWLFEILLQFTRLYIGDCVAELERLFEFIEKVLVDACRCLDIDDFSKYMTSESEDKNYEAYLSLQRYSASYIHISRAYI